MEYRLEMKASLTLLSILAPVVLAACASDATKSARPSPTFHIQDKLGELAKPTKVPSVTFAPAVGGQPGTVKLAEKVAFGPHVTVGLEVGYRLYEFPITDAEKPIDPSGLRSPIEPTAKAISVTAEISRSGYAWDVQRTVPWAASAPYHVVVTEVYERAGLLELVRSFDVRVFRVSTLPAVQVARFSFEKRFADLSLDGIPGSGTQQSVTTSADADPAPPSFTPSVTFNVPGRTATFHGKLAVASGMVPANRTLHLATYYGQSDSATTPPITFTALASNLVRTMGGTVTPAMCEVVVEGQDVEVSQELRYFWVLHVVEIWTTAMGSDPFVNTRVGTLTSYEMAAPANTLSSLLYFMK